VGRISIVVPALNEAENLGALVASIPFHSLNESGWTSELIVVDNGSTDGTGGLARELGARVIDQPLRGYGNAYKAGLAAADGDLVATGDADLTYPFDYLPVMIKLLEHRELDFLSTNRLLRSNRVSMKRSHTFGNHVLSATSRILFSAPFQDSQSGMWLFHRWVWERLDVRSPGMSFSQEIKHEAFVRGLRCGETDIEYRPRGGVVKLNASRDGLANLTQMFAHRARAGRPVPPCGDLLIDMAGPGDKAKVADSA
jgi:glycosyltransferase involved in cell wall biosynthesis